MTCPFCASWNQDDPNCGHVLLDGVLLPARYATRTWILKSEVGRGNYLDPENGGSATSRMQHIARQANYALSGGWAHKELMR